jgi:sigma-B regulation protein RsbU (phosphoserine phosphatase)
MGWLAKPESAAMTSIDISKNPRIPQLVNLLQSIGNFRDPHELVKHFVASMNRAYTTRCYIQIATRGLAPGEYRVQHVLDENGQTIVEYRADSASTPITRGGIIGEVVSTPLPKLLHNVDLGGEMDGKLKHYRSLMAVPVLETDVPIDWVIILQASPDAMTERDVEELVMRANLVGVMAKNLMTSNQLRIANGRIEAEMQQIARIQRSLLPDQLPKIPGVNIATSYNTFDVVGGDLYDFTSLRSPQRSDGRWALLIGDVSGHGPAAAVVMAMFHAILHTYPIDPHGPGEVLRHVNRHLFAKNIENSFVTAFLGFYDPRSRELVYARAGHNPPLLKEFPHNGTALLLDAVGEVPLGIVQDVKYSESAITLHPGQTLILYTDGITEAKRPGGEMFGVEGIERSLIECTGAPDCAIHHITDALKAHQVDVRPNDDQTVVVMQVV